MMAVKKVVKPKPEVIAPISTPTFSPTSPSTYVGGIPVSIPAAPAAPATTYNQRVVDAIKSGVQSEVDVNANPVTAAPTPTALAQQVNEIISNLPQQSKDLATIIAESNAAIAEANAALAAVPGSTPIPLVTDKVLDKAPDKASDKLLAIDTFRNTLALFFGKDEVTKPWVNALYNVTSKYYNTGSTIDESINLSVQDARNNPELKTFADRFSGIYALQDRLVKGEAIQVPTVAEYFKSESSMGDVLRRAGMGEVATQQFLGTVLGLGKSVIEVTNLINDTFNSIDNAPSALKKDLDSILNLGVSRTDIAKALLMGKEGAAELNKKISGISTLSAAKSQGVTIDMATASDLAMGGADYGKSLAGFADVKRLERGQALGRMSGIDFAQSDAIAAQFQSNVKAQDKIAKIVEGEGARFSGKTGRLQSQNRAQGLI